MGVEFGNPALAFGALAAAIPILIHLIQRRRPRAHPFAAIELVRRSQKRNTRRLRLKRLLLLAARTLVLLAIPLALARPRFASGASGAAAAPRGPAATALVLDGSMSMGYDDGGPLFERARADAREVLAGLTGEEPVTVLACDGRQPSPQAPSFDRSAARRAIDEAPASLRPADLSSCLAAAARALGESPVAGKRIWLFTDLTAAAWRLDAPAPSVTTPQGEVRPEVTVVDAARGKELPNAAITELTAGPAPEVGPRARSFSFTVRNSSAAPLSDLPVELLVGDEVVAKSFLDLPAGGATSKQLTYRFSRGGAFSGSLRLRPDALAADDSRQFLVQVPRDLRALVVNGAPSTVRFRDEAFFVDAALRMGGASPVAVTSVDAETFQEQPLDGFDLVLLLNVRVQPGDPGGSLARLDGFVKQGGGLFISLGDNVDAEGYNTTLAPVLPRQLHLPKAAGERGNDTLQPARFGELRTEHPVLSLFAGDAKEGLLAAKTYRYFLLAPGREGDGSEVLASYDDGAPALVERAVGKGRVLLYTSTVDRDWSDWPIQTSFLPVLQQSAAYLSRSIEERPSAPTLVGAPHQLELPAGAVLDAVVGPDGKERDVTAGKGGPPGVVGTARPGLYKVRGKLAGEPAVRDLWEHSFVVHVDPRESDTTRLEPAELKAHVGGDKVEVASDPSAGPRKETPLWSLLLVLGVVAFLAEGVLVRK